MTDLLQSGFTVLANLLKQYASQLVTYARGYDAVDIQACFGKKLLKLDDGFGGIRMEWTELDIIIPDVSDFHFGDGIMIIPERGDLIYITRAPYDVQTFEAVPYDNREPVWHWCDPYQTSLRIHTKEIDVEPYS